MKKSFFEIIAEDFEVSVSELMKEDSGDRKWQAIVKHGAPALVRSRRNDYTGFVVKDKFYYKTPQGVVTSVNLDSIKSNIEYGPSAPISEAGILANVARKIKPAAIQGAINMYRNVVNRKQDTGKKPLIIAAQSFNIDPRILQKELEKRGFIIESAKLTENYDIDIIDVNDSEQPVIKIEPSGNFSQKVRELKVKANNMGVKIEIDNAKKMAFINDATMPERKKLFSLKKIANQANKSLMGKSYIKNSETASNRVSKSIENNSKVTALYKQHRDEAIAFLKSLSNLSDKVNSNIVDKNVSQRINAKVQQYLNRFTGDLSQPEFLEELKTYMKASMKWKIDGRSFNYSDGNLAMIMAQVGHDDSVNSFGATDYWEQRGYEPRDPDKEYVVIIVPNAKFNGRAEGLNGFINSNRNNPNVIKALKSFIATYNNSRNPDDPKYSMQDLIKGGSADIPNDIVHRVDTYFSHAGLYAERGSGGSFRAIKIFANTQVKPISDAKQIDDTRDSLVDIDDNIEDKELLSLLLLAISRVIDNANIDLSVRKKKDMIVPSAAGVSMGGEIQVVDTMEGVSKLRTLVHELAHELLHHRYGEKLKGPSLADGETNRKEIEADSVAAMVLDMYGFPSKKSRLYVALNAMKKNKPSEVSDVVKGHLKSIRETTFWIMKELNKEIKEIKNDK